MVKLSRVRLCEAMRCGAALAIAKLSQPKHSKEHCQLLNTGTVFINSEVRRRIAMYSGVEPRGAWFSGD